MYKLKGKKVRIAREGFRVYEEFMIGLEYTPW